MVLGRGGLGGQGQDQGGVGTLKGRFSLLFGGRRVHYADWQVGITQVVIQPYLRIFFFLILSS